MSKPPTSTLKCLCRRGPMSKDLIAWSCLSLIVAGEMPTKYDMLPINSEV